VADQRFQELSEGECLDLLGGHRLGRLAVLDGGEPLVLPVNYLLDRGAVLYRTRTGGRLDVDAGAPAAFEVDAVDEATRTGWSVVVRGEAEPVSDPTELARVRRLPLSPWAPGERDNYIRVRPRSVTGRRVALADLPSIWWG
jgi:uncharacterized protein